MAGWLTKLTSSRGFSVSGDRIGAGAPVSCGGDRFGVGGGLTCGGVVPGAGDEDGGARRDAERFGRVGVGGGGAGVFDCAGGPCRGGFGRGGKSPPGAGTA